MDELAHKQIKVQLADTKILSYDELSDVKSDLDKNLNLTLDQIKRKDFKLISYGQGDKSFSLHYSTVLIPVNKFI